MPEYSYRCLLRKLPDDWKTLKVADLGLVVSGGTPSKDVPGYWDGDIPWVTPGEFTKLGSKYVEQTESRITAQGLRTSGANLLPENSLLVTTRATLGSRAINRVPMATNQGFKSICFDDPTSPIFYYYWTAKLIPELIRRASGTTFLEISGTEFSQIEVPAPPKAEAQKISEILGTLDTQIHQTETLLAKLEDIKRGLLTDLLTRGIDHNGQLRPRPDQAPELYKDSPLGKIPKVWTTPLLGELIQKHGGLIQTGPFGSQLHADEYVHHGVPVVMPQDMRAIEVSVEQIAQVTETRARDLARHRTQPNDVLFSRRGDLSRCCVMTKANHGWLCGTGCLLARLPESILSGYWLGHIYKQPAVQSQVYGMAVGSTMVNLNSGILASVIIALPPTEEQIEFEKRMKALSERIDSEVETVEKLKAEKSGLMDDILTGRVRVTPLLEAAGS